MKQADGMGRTFDVVAATIGLVVLSPVFLLVAACIQILDQGPTIFEARRVGRDGVLFEVYKFRTMINKPCTRGPAITAKGDPRITPIGRILRRTKLDELPQLVNVLKGDMAIVGPRPEDPRYVDLYSQEQRRILTVRPGITSAASVFYRREEELLAGADWETTYRTKILPEKLAIDLDYIDRRSRWTDIKIIGQTILALLK